MSSGAGKDAKEATINVGKTFAHITKFKEGAFSVWIMSITVTLMGVAEISTTMANVHTLLEIFEKFQGLSLAELHKKIAEETKGYGDWTEANKKKASHEYYLANTALYQIIFMLLDDSIPNLQTTAASKFKFNGIDLLKHMYVSQKWAAEEAST